MRFLLYVGSVFILGVIGIIGIYIRFLAVLVSIFLNCIKLSAEAVFAKISSGHLGRSLPTKAD